MTDYLTEQEQIELLKNWIKQYSLVILAGVVLAIIAMTAWRYWDQRQSNILTHASSVYDEMLTMRAQNEPAEVVVQGKKLFSHYPKTIYGQMAALMLSRSAAVKTDYAAAEKHLEWVMKKSNIDAIRQIARLRLARVKLADNKPDETIRLLEKIDDNSFLGLIDEVRGDAYLAMNNHDKARESYHRALAELPNAEAVRPLLQMKYDNLATTESAS